MPNQATVFDEQVFVFGSNLAGRHGRGAALHARKVWGAEYGVGVGRTGNSYAIPTKDENLKQLSWEAIEEHVKSFTQYARDHPLIQFYLTPIGTGLAGHSAQLLIDSLFIGHIPDNVYLTSSWIPTMIRYR